MQPILIFPVFIGEASKLRREAITMDDKTIIDLYWARSESAISETVKQYGSYCIKIATNILQNSEDAEECLNDALQKAWNSIPPQRPDNFRAFLGRITRNLSLNKYHEQRARKRGGNNIALIYTELEDCLPSSHNVEEEYESGLIVESINAFLATLDSISRMVFVRRYWYADPIGVIATRFKMSESKVKSMLFRTRKKLKTYLESKGVML